MKPEEAAVIAAAKKLIAEDGSLDMLHDNILSLEDAVKALEEIEIKGAKS